MANVINNKLKTFYLLQELLEKSDDEHRISTSDLIAAVEAHGLHIDRKSVYDAIESMIHMGYDIMYSREAPSGYYIGKRDFDVAELKLLVDAVQSSKFITDRKSHELINKLGKLTSIHQGKNLERQVYVINRVKTLNESIYYNVDRIHEAIINNKQISFTYHRWNLKKKLEPKNSGRPYVVSPWAMTWEDENYYLIAFDEAADMMKYYRVDKMKSITVLDEERIGSEAYDDFDISKFATRTFNMWGAESETIELRCTNDLIGAIIDRFGRDITVIADDEEHFKVGLEVSVSKPFFGWLVGLGSGVEILNPENVKEEFENHLRSFLE